MKQMKDSLANLITDYSVYIIVSALFVEVVLMPINAMNLVLIIVMSRIILKYF